MIRTSKSSPNYIGFLKEKEMKDSRSGFEPKSLNPMLYDFQEVITRWAIRRGRAAVFADCGLGKTPIQLDWAQQINRKTKKPVLILAPLAVSKQTKREGDKFNIPVKICQDQSDVCNGVNITNYEKLHKFDPKSFAGIVLDESSILKSYTGKFRNFIIESFAQTPYKLACTATPAPNDYMELGNHSEFLNVLSRVEMLSLFFINDTSNVGNWRLKKHGIKKFWRWLCSWAVMISKPSDLGFEDGKFILPKLNIIEDTLKFGKPSCGKLLATKATTLDERRKARRESIPLKTELIKKLVSKNESPWLLWCDLNRESESLHKEISNSVQITGSDKDEFKEREMLRFSRGRTPVLVTKPKIAGFGMNWQCCSNVIFVGLSDSYESFYQAVRRCWRFGQEKEVEVHIITTDIEGNIVDNIKRKEKDAIRMRNEMIRNTQDITKKELTRSSGTKTNYTAKSIKEKDWELHLGDSVELIKNIDTDSIGFTMFSPPFAALYTYTDSIRDMGNCKNQNEFLQHFRFLIPELYRVTMPGRLMAVHCMNLITTLTRDGYIGRKDFRGDLIYLFEAAGFIYHSEVCIWHDPLIQAVRTKALNLMHKQVVKDSAKSGQGLADYIVVMLKPGDNPKPISRPLGFSGYVGEIELPKAARHKEQTKNKYSHEIWQRYASPVWFDIRQTHTLNYRLAREEKDERHICPLQLDTVRRCLELWSTEGDIVLDPFAGIGTVPYCAVEMERHGIGFELKESYFNEAIKNLKRAEENKNYKGLLERDK